MANRKPGSRDVQNALGYQYYMDRLDDPGLLDRAVVAENGELIVPVGGKRKGGWISANTRAEGRRIVRQLAARPDEFPGIRLYRGDGWIIEWGPDLDWRGNDDLIPEDYIAAGRLFGYTEAAIAAYGQRMRALGYYLKDGEE